MINVHIYGLLKKKFDANASLGENMIITLKHRDGLLLQELFKELDLSQDECGECFVNGKVIKATFPKPELTYLCKSDLKKKLLTMTGWKPGQMDGTKVCTHFYWPVSCIKWE